MKHHHLLAGLAGLTLGLAGLLVHADAHAADFSRGAVTVSQPYARATAPGQPVGGGFMTIANKGADDRLLSATSKVAENIELHTMRMEGDVMRMRQVEAIALPAGQRVEFKPGALHMMFMGLKAPLKAGDKVPVTLKFEKAGELKVMLSVQAPGADAPAHKH